MQVSSKAVNLCKHYEQGPKGGHASVVYYCPAGKPTIGYGHVVLPTDKFTYPMDEPTAFALLMSDLNQFSVKVAKLVKASLTQDQFDALVCLTFNTGVGKADGIKGDFADSTLLSYVNKSQFQLAFAEFGKWVYAGGKVSNGLVFRRKTEALLFSTGELKFFN